jgi:hypothetical protein
VPDAAFVAPQSLLVFDHVTRRIALLHAGPEPESRRRSSPSASARARNISRRVTSTRSCCRCCFEARPTWHRSRSTAHCDC